MPDPSRRAAVAVTALVLVLLLVPGTTTASGQQGLRLDVAVGFDDSGQVAGWVPVTVSFVPERPLRGEVRVVSTRHGSPVTVAVPVEVGAGAPVAVRMAVPAGSLEVAVLDGDDVVASRRRHILPLESLALGVLEGAADGPAFTHLPSGLSARWLPVEAEWLEVPNGLDSLDVLVVAPDVWQDLDEVARAAIWADVVLGGLTLVLTGPVPDPPGAGLDLDAPGAAVRTVDDGQGTAAVVAAAGLGRVALTRLASTGPQVWEALAGPRPGLSPLADLESAESQPFAAQELLRQAHAAPEVPRIPFLGVFLLAYLLLVGPVNAWVLHRRGRPELAWVTVPAVSLVFTLVPVLTVTGSPGSTTMTTRSVAWWLDGVGEQRVASAWLAHSSGPVSARLDGRGWSALPWGGQLVGAAVQRLDGAVEVTGQARVGEVAGVVASRPLAEPPPLAVSARWVDGQVRVEVTNSGQEAYTDVQLVVANRVVDLPDLPAGHTHTQLDTGQAELSRPRVRGFPPPPVPEGTAILAGPDAVAMGGPHPDHVVVPGPLRHGVPGVVWVVAQGPAPVGVVDLASDVDTEVAQQMVAVGASVDVTDSAAGGSLAPATVLLQPVHVPHMPDQLRVWDEAFAARLLLRAQLASWATDAQMAVYLDGIGLGVEVWDDTARTWRSVEAFEPVGDLAALLTPAGELWLRADNAQGGIAVAARDQVLGPPPDNPVGGVATGELEPLVLDVVPMPSPTPVPVPPPDGVPPLQPSPVPPPEPTEEGR